MESLNRMSHVKLKILTSTLYKVLSLIGSWLNRYPRAGEILLVPCILFLIFWFLLGKYLLGDYNVATWQDNTFIINPMFHFLSKTLSSGQTPYRIDLLLGGLPLYNWSATSWLYPFYFLNWGLFQTPLDAAERVNCVVFLHVLILYINTYIMLRLSGLRVIPSILAASLFAFSANTASYITWVVIIAPYSWFPLALGAVVLILENRSPIMGIMLGIASVSLLAISSPAQPLIHFVFCTALLFMAYMVQYRKSNWNGIVVIKNLAFMAGGSMLIAAPVFLPVLLSNFEMIRWLGPHGHVIGYAKLPVDALTIGAVSLSELAGVLFPLKDVSHIILVGDMYMGLIPALLAIVGIFCYRHNWLILPFTIGGFFCLLSLTGKDLGLVYLSHKIPLWNMIREPGRHLFIFLLFFYFLTAHGFQYLWSKNRDSAIYRTLAWSLVVFVPLLSISYWISRSHTTDSSAFFLIGGLVGFIVLTFSGKRVSQVNRHVLSVLAAGLVIYSTVHANFFIPLIKDGDLFSDPNRKSHEVLQQIAGIKDIRDYRLIVEDDQFNVQFWSMNAIYYGISTFRAYFNPMPYQQFLDMYYHQNVKHYFNVMGAKYYVCSTCNKVPAGYSFERAIADYKLFVAEKVCSRYSFFTRLGEPYVDQPNFLHRLGKDGDYTEKAYLDAKRFTQVAPWLGAQPEDGQLQIMNEKRSLNDVVLLTKTNSRGILVLNEYFSPEWRAYLSGKNVPLFRVNWCQIGLLLPPGTNQVCFEYRPEYFPWILYLQRIAIFSLVACAALGLWRSRQEVHEWLFRKVHL